MVYRVFVEKKPELAAEARALEERGPDADELARYGGDESSDGESGTN